MSNLLFFQFCPDMETPEEGLLDTPVYALDTELETLYKVNDEILEKITIPGFGSTKMWFLKMLLTLHLSRLVSFQEFIDRHGENYQALVDRSLLNKGLEEIGFFGKHPACKIVHTKRRSRGKQDGGFYLYYVRIIHESHVKLKIFDVKESVAEPNERRQEEKAVAEINFQNLIFLMSPILGQIFFLAGFRTMIFSLLLMVYTVILFHLAEYSRLFDMTKNKQEARTQLRELTSVTQMRHFIFLVFVLSSMFIISRSTVLHDFREYFTFGVQSNFLSYILPVLTSCVRFFGTMFFLIFYYYVVRWMCTKFDKSFRPDHPMNEVSDSCIAIIYSFALYISLLYALKTNESDIQKWIFHVTLKAVQIILAPNSEGFGIVGGFLQGFCLLPRALWINLPKYTGSIWYCLGIVVGYAWSSVFYVWLLAYLNRFLQWKRGKNIYQVIKNIYIVWGIYVLCAMFW